MSSRISEVILVIVLVVIAGFSRVYYDSADGPMVVWKSEFSFKDTLVDLSSFLRLPHSEMVREHPAVVGQLEDMGLVETIDDAAMKVRKRRIQRRVPIAESNGSKNQSTVPVPISPAESSKKKSTIPASGDNTAPAEKSNYTAP